MRQKVHTTLSDNPICTWLIPPLTSGSDGPFSCVFSGSRTLHSYTPLLSDPARPPTIINTEYQKSNLRVSVSMYWRVIVVCENKCLLMSQGWEIPFLLIAVNKKKDGNDNIGVLHNYYSRHLDTHYNIIINSWSSTLQFLLQASTACGDGLRSQSG